MVTYKDELNNNNKSQLDNNTEDIKLLQDAQNGNKEAIEQIIRIHLPLAIGMVNKLYANRNMDQDDLIGYANIGLMVAIQKYKFDKNTKFSTYAVMRIRQFCGRALEKDNTVNYSSEISNLKIKYVYFVNDYYKEHLENPPIELFAKELNISLDKAKYVEQSVLGTQSLDYEYDNDNKMQIQDKIPNPEQQYINGIDNDLLISCINKLDVETKTIIELRFGLYDGNCYNLKPISKKLGIKYSDIKLLEQQGLEMLREMLLDSGYDEY
jgi:RNA polymerase sigma factor (sigma-70 family)